MTYDFDATLAELAEAAKTIRKQAKAEALEDLFQDDAALKAFGKKYFSAFLSGIGYQDRYPPLSVVVFDREDAGAVEVIDPIQRLFDEHPYPFIDEESGEVYARAIAALESGIDRIRTYQASAP